MAVSLTAQCTDVYDINNASGGPGRLKRFVACDDSVDRVEVSDQRDLDQVVWWWHLGCQAPFTFPGLAVQLQTSGVNSPLAMWLYPGKTMLVGK